MNFTFFSKTDKTPRESFFKVVEGITDDTQADGSIRDQEGISSFKPSELNNDYSYRRIRFLPPKEEDLEELLERLLMNAESARGPSRSRYLERMFELLEKYPDYVNRVPKKFHSNPLELALTLGDFQIAMLLVTKLKAQVRPENRSLLKKIEHILLFKSPVSSPRPSP